MRLNSLYKLQFTEIQKMQYYGCQIEKTSIYFFLQEWGYLPPQVEIEKFEKSFWSLVFALYYVKKSDLHRP